MEDPEHPLREPTSDHNEISRQVIDASLKVHRVLGPGLLESVYEIVLADELRARGLEVSTQVPQTINYEGRAIASAFRIDPLVSGQVLVELKSVNSVTDVHRKQTLTYLRLSGLRLGLLINFNVPLLKQGITRIVNSSDP